MPYSFQSLRITARSVTESEVPDIEAVYEGNRKLLSLLDREKDPSALARRFVDGLNLPTRGVKANLHNLILRETLSLDAIGLASLYVGYPKADIAYVGELFLAPQFQGVGFGREAYLALEALLRAARLSQVRVGVGLRNWNALRFWLRLGFAQITGMSGDRNFGPGCYAFVELQKNL